CDVQVIFKKPPSGGPDQQKEVIDTLMAQDIKAIAVSVINPDGQRVYLDEIADKVPLICVDNDAPNTKRRCYIGTSNYEAGRTVGKLVKEAMPQGGTIVIFVGDDDPLNARQRRGGVLDELGDRPQPGDINKIGKSDPPDRQQYGKYFLHRTYLDMAQGG